MSEKESFHDHEEPEMLPEVTSENEFLSISEIFSRFEKNAKGFDSLQEFLTSNGGIDLANDLIPFPKSDKITIGAYEIIVDFSSETILFPEEIDDQVSDELRSKVFQSFKDLQSRHVEQSRQLLLNAIAHLAQTYSGKSVGIISDKTLLSEKFENPLIAARKEYEKNLEELKAVIKTLEE
ncbi:MAG: hypothetical protein HY453_01130 [Parcubacteria group bacterium]|nr:hypothetical protein [Parcubacteria group bacterium]